ncbi:cullin-4A [Trichonephila clavipes]|nr:cullin-4A [Trichonephila clavipes]
MILFDCLDVVQNYELQRQHLLLFMQSSGLQLPDLGSNPGEGRDVCKCIVPLRHGGTQNSRRAASPLVRLEEEWWEASDQPQGVLPPNWSGTEPNRIITCMVFKVMANDRCAI